MFVAAKWGDVCVVSSYFSPSASLVSFGGALQGLDRLCTTYAASLIICGDFNAHSVLWSTSASNRRGELLERWAASRDLRLTNRGVEPTCVRPQGSSVMDLTWVSPGLAGRVCDWVVRGDLESLSDYLYIEFSIETSVKRASARSGASGVRWNFKKIDGDLFANMLDFILASAITAEMPRDPNLYAKWLMSAVRDAVDVSAPRVGCARRERAVYW